MAKTRKKSVQSPAKGRKPNTTLTKSSPIISHKRGAKTRAQRSKNMNIKTMLYESPLRHLQHNGEQSSAQSQSEETEVKESEDLAKQNKNQLEINQNTKAECESVVNDNEATVEASTNGSSKTKRNDTDSSVESDVLVPVKKRKLNKSPLSRFNETNQPASTNVLGIIDESVICVDDLDVDDSTNDNSAEPQLNHDDIIVIDGSQPLSLEPNSQISMPTQNLIDSVIVLDDESQPSTSKTISKPTEDCMVVWSSLPTPALSPTTTTTLTASKPKVHKDILKMNFLSLDTRGESSNLKYLRNDNCNKKLVKKSPKVTKFGVKKLNTKKVSEITKGLAKTKIATKVLPKVNKTPVKKKNKGDLIFAAQHSESKTKQANNNSKQKKGTLREIVIDGCNVAMAYTNNKVFNEKGIKMLIDYFTKKGHTVKVFVPQHKRARHHPMLEKWHDEGIVVFTPSRKVGNKCITSYDDRFIIEYATTCKGIVVSQDQFRDLYAEKAEYKDTIENRLLIPTFVGDYVMFPEDPLGRHGPSLAEFLKH